MPTKTTQKPKFLTRTANDYQRGHANQPLTLHSPRRVKDYQRGQRARKGK